MSTGPTAVSDLLDDLLAEAVNSLNTTDGADPPPESQFVAQGTVAWDCDLLAVHLVRLEPKLLDPRAERCAIVHMARVAVTLLRCVPKVDDNGQPPSPAEMDTANRQLAVDGWALWKGLTRAWADGSWPIGIPCKNVKWGGLEPLAPSGGLAGWRVEATVQL